MKNEKLSQEIILHIKNLLSVDRKFVDDLEFGFLSNNYLLEKKLVIKTDVVRKNKVWAARRKVQNNSLSVVVADLSESDKDNNFAFIIQVTPSFYYLFYCYFDINHFYISSNESLVQLKEIVQFSRFLTGLEEFFQIPSFWEGFEDHTVPNAMYDQLFKFLQQKEEEIGEET